MTEHIDLTTLKGDDWVTWFIVEALGKDIDNVDALGHDKTKVQVSLVVNGVEVPLHDTIRSLGARFDAAVTAKAKELIDTLFDLSEVHRLQEELASALKSKLASLNDEGYW